MDILNINWLALVVGTLTIFVINAIWFGPKTFYPMWWAALGKEPTKPEDQDTSAKTMVRLFGGTFAGALAQSIVLFIMVQGASTHFDMNLLFGAVIGLALGVVAAAASLGHRLFAMQGFKVWIIEVGADLLALTVAGAVIAAFITA
jgi:hypothetical protein